MLKAAFRKIYQELRIIKYNLLSDNSNIYGYPIKKQPVLYCGKGKISFDSNVILGYKPSPFYYNGSIYLEARHIKSKISFGKNVFINNNLIIICEGSSIEIGNDILIGTNVEIIDSDFHEIEPAKRNSGYHKCISVKIEDNVFIGSNVRIMKGVTIGQNSIIANGAIVTTSFSKNVIIAGNPAKVVRNINL